MYKFRFSKMHGAGNDFIMALNTPENPCPTTPDSIRFLCGRRRGIGADGIIFITPKGENTFVFSYWNADGSAASMCGNGLRCAMEFVSSNGLVSGKSAQFLTDSGVLSAERLAPGLIRISMPAPKPFIEKTVCGYRCFFTDTGVPHAVVETDSLESLDVDGIGRELRYDPAFGPDGTNVDFIRVNDPDTAMIRTYERGVEAETDACGTGITAAGVYLWKFYCGSAKKTLFSHGGDKLEIEITENCNMLQEVHLTGPAQIIFSGLIESEQNQNSYMEK